MLCYRLPRLARYITTMSQTPIENTIRTKITAALKPTTLEIYNDSSMHAHHKAMEGSMSKETHFRLVITSEAFSELKTQIARHRIVHGLLKEEMERPGGIHALQLRTRTPKEEEAQVARENTERGELITDVENNINQNSGSSGSQVTRL